MRKDIINVRARDPRADAAARDPVSARRSPASARSRSPATPTARRSTSNGKLVGSKIIGQAFTDQVVKNGKPQVDKDGNPVTDARPAVLPGRPSATVPPYNAAATTFSNLGPNNNATEQAIASNIQSYLALEKPYDPALTKAQVPVDAVEHLGVRHRPGHLARERRHPGAPRRRGPAPAARRR